MTSREVWLDEQQLIAFIEACGGRMQSAYGIWHLLTEQFPRELREVYGEEMLEFRRVDGETELALSSLSRAMEFLDPCWIMGYGARQHRWLNEWVTYAVPKHGE